MDRTVDQAQVTNEIIGRLEEARQSVMSLSVKMGGLYDTRSEYVDWLWSSSLTFFERDAVIERSWDMAIEEEKEIAVYLAAWDDAIQENAAFDAAARRRTDYALKVAYMMSEIGSVLIILPPGERPRLDLSYSFQTGNPDTVKATMHFRFWEEVSNERLAKIRERIHRGIWKREVKAPSYEGGKPTTTYTYENEAKGVTYKITKEELAPSCRVSYNETEVEEEVEEIVQPAITKKVMKKVVKRTPVVICND